MYLGEGSPDNVCYVFSTVKEQKSLLLDLNCKLAEGVRDLQEQLGFSLDVNFANAIKYNVLQTCEYN